MTQVSELLKKLILMIRTAAMVLVPVEVVRFSVLLHLLFGGVSTLGIGNRII